MLYLFYVFANFFCSRLCFDSISDCDIFSESNLSQSERFKNSLLSLAQQKQSQISSKSSSSSAERPTGRFISSILGGDIPYGSVGHHVLTQAQRKAYPSIPSKRDTREASPVEQPKLAKEKEIVPNEEPISLTTNSKTPPPSKSPTPEPVVRCSVIKRTPATAGDSDADKSDENSNSDSSSSSPQKNRKSTHRDIDVKLPPDTIEHQTHVEPEQDQPIDYHIPKRRDDDRIDEKEMKYRIIKRTSAIISRPVYSIWNAPNAMSHIGKVNGIMSAAAGHGRQNSSNQTQQGTNGNSSNGNHSNYGGGGGANNGNGSNSGGMSNGNNSGSNGGRDGRDGRSNYGPNSPPTGSLPPFYESLKSGNGALNAYNAANANFLAQNGYNHMMGSNLNMDCDTTQEFPSNFSTETQANAAKQFSMLHNAAYGIVLKDEIDLEYETKPENNVNSTSNILHGNYNHYDMNTDNMMVDMNNGVVDPLQFTATLTFSSPAEHALLDSLTDAVDLSSLLQRLPNDDQSSPNGNDLEISSTPSLTPDSVSVTAADNNCLEQFPEILMNRNNFERSAGYNMHGSNRFPENPPSYQQSREMQQLIQQQQQHQHQQQHVNIHVGQQQQHHNSHHSSDQMTSSYDIDSHSNLSLPSPGSVSMDAPPDAKPIIQSVSGRIDSKMAFETKHRVSI